MHKRTILRNLEAARKWLDDRVEKPSAAGNTWKAENGAGLSDGRDFGRLVGRTCELGSGFSRLGAWNSATRHVVENAEVVALPEVVASRWSGDARGACRSQ